VYKCTVVWKMGGLGKMGGIGGLAGGIDGIGWFCSIAPCWLSVWFAIAATTQHDP
jgi:hypothetical protein